MKVGRMVGFSSIGDHNVCDNYVHSDVGCYFVHDRYEDQKMEILIFVMIAVPVVFVSRRIFGY